MKKILLLFAIVFCFTFSANAQPKSIGLRLGASPGISYQHYLGGKNFIEGSVNFSYTTYYSYFYTAAYYNFVIAQPKWTEKGTWGVYAGPGAGIGLLNAYNSNHVHFGIGAQLGLEYSFEFPLTVSIDFYPSWYFGAYSSNYNWLSLYAPSIGVRYKF